LLAQLGVVQRRLAAAEDAVDARDLPLSDGAVRGVSDRFPVITGGVGAVDHQRVLRRGAIGLVEQTPGLVEQPGRYLSFGLVVGHSVSSSLV